MTALGPLELARPDGVFQSLGSQGVMGSSRVADRGEGSACVDAVGA